MMMRVLAGGLCGLVGGLAGPGGAYAGWKLGGFLATGNPFHLVPGGSAIADAGEIADVAVDALKYPASSYE